MNTRLKVREHNCNNMSSTIFLLSNKVISVSYIRMLEVVCYQLRSPSAYGLEFVSNNSFVLSTVHYGLQCPGI